MKDVMILTGAGQIGMAIARRMGYGMKIVVGDKKIENAQTISKIMNEAVFDAVPVEMDLSSRDSIMNMIAEAKKYGEISMLVNAAGVSPSQAPVEAILKVDLYGTASKKPFCWRKSGKSSKRAVQALRFPVSPAGVCLL